MVFFKFSAAMQRGAPHSFGITAKTHLNRSMEFPKCGYAPYATAVVDSAASGQQRLQKSTSSFLLRNGAFSRKDAKLAKKHQ
ncbi:MAG: hypothetical protein KDE53_24205, partial [Caldilineaceae bacterium]|nr:hypothetical protein [Caldilineaceae bacterium]MCB0123046.1 hypothetical protein [Caldilineaceae bacterium]